MKTTNKQRFKNAVVTTALFCMTTQSTFAALLNLPNTPLFAAAGIPPKVLLTISKDQQLYKKAYNDYSDLDGDGEIESTYKHSINYYGYFDSAKCYTYSTTNDRFEPASVTTDKYCTNEWSGNFLNWVSMSRMDAVRKLLYGGTRSTDQTNGGSNPNAVTVLERAYIPTDAHAWAKYYNGSDIARLTPFNPPTSPTPFSASTSSFTIPTTGQDIDIPFSLDQRSNIAVGDQIMLTHPITTSTMLGAVLSTSSTDIRVRVNVQGVNIVPPLPNSASTSWTVVNLSRTGISFCNVTPGGSGADARSSTNTQPPLIRVAQGNFALWNANERVQCLWSQQSDNRQSGFGGIRSNGNQAALSEIYASAESPSQTSNGLGTGYAQGDYVARVQVCVPSLLGDEKCERYPRGNYKPIGLLQQYGDRELIHFGLMTGSHAKNISGGVLRKNVGPLSDEVNVNTDGTFVTPVYRPPNATRSASSSSTSPGIIRTLDFMRIYGYRYFGSAPSVNGDYLPSIAGDNCNYQLTNIVEGECTSWGNPMSETFYETLRYFAGRSPTSGYTYGSSSKDNELGLPVATWSDPLTSSTYCAPLNVLVFNASVSTNDTDLGSRSAAGIGSSNTIEELTNAVGNAEGITNNPYFVGKLIGSGGTSSTATDFELCTAKTITALGNVSGICPEGPTLAGSYHIAGVAHYARTNRIRTDIVPPTTDTKALKVTSYGIQLATNVPTLTIPVPGSGSGQKVVIQPIYRLDLGAANRGGGGLVDIKFVRQDVAAGTGKVYINWEDSEQGGDYDQDMWGIIEWSIDTATNKITVTTNAVSQSTANPQGFGYAISGTTQDGAHFHSGILGFNFTDPASTVPNPLLGCTNCQHSSAASGQRGPTSNIYNIGTATGGTLKDPLWYLAKYGAFDESMPAPVSNKNNLPDLQDEWDSKLADGTPGQDGIPDNYFLVTNPLGLEAALERAFQNILANASLTSVAANSTSLQTLSHIYQARFNTADWSGSLAAYAVQPDASIAPTASWDVAQVLNGQSWDTERTIITFNDTASVRDGVAFRWSSISTTLQAALNKLPTTGATDSKGSQRLNYLRGDATYEVTTGTTRFRIRPTTKLGDIINSDPMYVGAPNALILDPTYATFRATSGIGDRMPMVYAAANDGMLHGFNAVDGKEKLGYIPSKTFPHLNKLTHSTYAHRFFVDGSPEVADAQVGGQWKTVLVGGLGRGGQGIYALDVTRPGDFNESNAASIALWEFNDTDDVDTRTGATSYDLGYTFGKPLIRKMANGKWAAIVSGGYNNSESDGAASTTGRAYLYVIFLDGPSGANRTWVAGTDYIKIDTGTLSGVDATTPNGLADPFAADTNVDSKVDYVYAGDLRGNFWKFDLSDSNEANWTLSKNRVVLFQAKDGSGNAQPITGPAEGTLHPTGNGYIISFGTGKYLENVDTTSTSVQSFYGIWDKDDKINNIATQTTVSARSELLQQTASNVTVGSAVYRVVSDNAADWTTHRGWYMDFPTTGERSVFRPLILSGRLIFTTLIPSGAACSFGGTSFLMIVDPSTGARISGAVLDTSGDGQLTAADKVTSGGTSVYASGAQSTVGITPTPAIVIGGSTASVASPGSEIYGTAGPLLDGMGLLIAYAIGGGTGGRTTTILGLAASSGRVTWREVLSR